MKMYKYILLSLILLPFNIISQGIINYGANIYVDLSSYLNLTDEGDFVIEDDNLTLGSLTNHGLFILDGNFLNNSTTVDLAIGGIGIIEFNGISPQEIGGENSIVIQNIKLSNGVFLSNDLSVLNTLDLSNGIIDVKDNDLIIENGAVISGVTDENFVIAENEGSLVMFVTEGGPSVLFPVATSTSYTPAYILLNSGGSQYFSVRLKDGVWSDGLTGVNIANDEPIVDRTWIIYSDVVHSVDLVLQWNESDELNGFDRETAFSNIYSDSWITANAVVSGTDPYQVAFSDVTDLTSSSIHTFTSDQSSLDVDLLEFSGVPAESSNIIKWITASEQNSYCFVLSKSVDNHNFTSISVQYALGNSNTNKEYNFEDFSNINGTVYYQLELHDFDGKIQKFNTISISRNDKNISINYFNQKLFIDLVSSIDNRFDIFIYDVSGRIIYQKEVEKTNGNSLMLDNLPNLTAGIYTIIIQNNSHLIIADKFMAL